MLSDVKIRSAKPGEKPVKLFDGGGMFLLVTPAGGKCWRLKYRFGGKEKTLALGTYPEISLADARQRKDEARKLLANGVDPNEDKKTRKVEEKLQQANTFERVAREWHEKNRHTWIPSYADQIMRRLAADIFPVIGDKPISELKPMHLLAALQGIEKRGALESAHRIKQTCGQIMRYAVGIGAAERDITTDLRGALPPVKGGHHAALTDPKEIAPLLRAIDGFEGSFIVKCALRLAPLLFVRPGELRKAEWSEIDLEAAEWNIPPEKMKMGQPHIVPLSDQSLAILRELHPLTGCGRYVFPCSRSAARPMSNMALSAAIRRLGYEQGQMTTHGFRAMARTILDEVLHFRPDFIEHQLAHAVRDPNGRAYNRTTHLVERRKMMQTWADYLDGLKAGATVIPLHRAQK